jgi:Putative peptidoglycan binding domain
VRTAVALVAVLAAATGAVALTEPWPGGGKAKPDVAGNGYPTSVAMVARRSLSSRTAVSGTLGYAGSYSVVNEAAGTLTWLPRPGQVIRRGQVLYEVAGDPVVLLSGRTPAYRTLKRGMSGPDVEQLNANLVALGYGAAWWLDATSDYFSWATKHALEQLQDALDIEETGTLALGQAVFLPRALRITKLSATLGTRAMAGGVIAQASSTRRHVVVKLDAAQQTSVKAGDRVAITLPNSRTTRGVVTAVGKVASTSGGESEGAKIPVYIAPRNPRVAGSLDQAPVQVAITTARVKRALVVPGNALLARAGGGYAVETVDARGVHRLVSVTLGLFDDADGVVQVIGSSLRAGDRVVVPAA